jgi:hypothetical protein
VQLSGISRAISCSFLPAMRALPACVTVAGIRPLNPGGEVRGGEPDVLRAIRREGDHQQDRQGRTRRERAHCRGRPSGELLSENSTT